MIASEDAGRGVLTQRSLRSQRPTLNQSRATSDDLRAPCVNDQDCFVSFVSFVVHSRISKPPRNPPDSIVRTADVHAAGHRIRLSVTIEITNRQGQ